MKVLDSKQIREKIDRLAYEILESNYDVKELIFLGINKNGLRFAKLLKKAFDNITENDSTIGSIKLNAANPLDDAIELDLEFKSLKNKVLILVDDVANTGRTLFYGAKPLMDHLPKKIEAAVLVDRKHKTFPIKIDYVGLSLATTFQENIKVDLGKITQSAVFLE